MGLHLDLKTENLIWTGATCWKLAAGRWQGIEIPADNLQLSEWKVAPAAQIPEAIDGKEDAAWKGSTRATVGEIATRITPHAVWYAAPAFFGCERDSGWAGLAFRAGPVVVLRTCYGEHSTVSSAFHEAWHVVERLLTREEMAAVDGAVGRGGNWQGGYYDSMIERRARAFQNWAMARHEAPPAARLGTAGAVVDIVSARLLPPHEQVFLAAWDGRTARRAAATGRIVPRRLPDPARRQALADRAALKARRESTLVADLGIWACVLATVTMLGLWVAHHVAVVVT